MNGGTGKTGRDPAPVENSEKTMAPPPPRTMRAVVQVTYGSADVLRVEDVPVPRIGPDDVLVRVYAAGMDRGTWHLMAGKPYLMRLMGFGLRAPKNPVAGLDVAGTVAAVGADVTRFEVGDEVFGISQGAFAEYARARADKLAHKPASLGFPQAAVVAVSGLAALQSVRDRGHVESGQQVLIVGASGGVGTYAVQIAKAAGAEVTGVCSTAKVDLVRSVGADHVVDYTREDFTTGSRRYDLIVDIGGGSPLSKLRRALRPRGTLVLVGGEGGDPVTGGFGRQLRILAASPLVRQRITMQQTREHYSDLERLARLLEDQAITPVVDRTYPLRQTPEAMRHLAAGHARGKLAITIVEAG